MAPYAKDSAILLLRAGEDGYFTSYYLFDQSPPPINLALDAIIQSSAGAALTARQDRVSANKTELKTELGLFVDNFFDVP